MGVSLGLTARFLLCIVPMFLLASGVGFLLELDFDKRGSIDQLGARIGNQAGRIAATLARHHSVQNQPLAQDLIATLSSDRAVMCVELRTSQGNALIASMPPKVGCSARNGEHQLLLPVASEPPSKLRIGFSSQEVDVENLHHSNTMISAIILVLLVLVASTVLAFRFIVSNRLTRLHKTIQTVIDSGERPQVTETGNDELGLIMRAFNDMMLRETQREAALETSNEALAISQVKLQHLNDALAQEVRAHEEKQRFRDYADSASDWYWEMDAHLRFSSFSSEFEIITGVDPQTLLGKTRNETGIPDVPPAAWQQHLDDLSNHRPFRNFTHPRQKSDGDVVWLAINGQPVFDEKGHFEGYRGTGSDVTERIRAEEKLIEAKEASELAARTKSEFLANMSHEIRTPINGVMGMIDLLLKTSLDDQQRRFVETISHSSEILLSVINDVLDFSKIEAGKLEIQCAPLNLRMVVEDVVTALAELADSKNVELICDIPAEVDCELLGDGDRIRQVLMNLTNNAIKFTESGHVLVRILCNDLATHESQSLRIEVCDTGIGIDATSQSRIFESFSQADGSTTRKYGGTGLGLTISRTLVNLMGGEIGVTSTPKVGSMFWFTLTLEKNISAAHSPVERTQDLDGYRVLIIDPQPVLAEALENQLRAWGLLTTVVADSQGAVKALQHLREQSLAYDFVLIGHRPPDVDAFELAKTIHASANDTVIQIVGLTSIRNSVDVSAVQECYIDKFLCKPVRQAELLNCLQTPGTRKSPPLEEKTPKVIDVPRPCQLYGKVLVAEDNPVNQDITKQLLHRVGLDCVIVEDGHEVLEAIVHEHFDVVLMDCQMPGMDGYEAATAIRRRESEDTTSGHLPIIAVTANALTGDRDACIAAGMDDYLSKPFRVADLHNVLMRWLPTEPAALSCGEGERARTTLSSSA